MTTRRTTPKTLEPVYTVKEAAWLLKLADETKPEGGVRFLRDGVNREHDPFPHARINGQLRFSESQLAEIFERHINAPNTRTGRPRMKRRAAKRSSSPRPVAACQALAA
ncbi:hypothetical protein [Streptomyces nymphaeiformis]|uniref:Uncharacterized protein n=1 Tax=Streptomyces nymphaeiformis TaxID=2663842 RepID=A0A7W7U4K9_9ACTN|nr:hypothetical protein [Streptomyces nymphaeiformis]MBB4984953.1 hypothetical protein [Streptomyces nymphaeiformis]